MFFFKNTRRIIWALDICLFILCLNLFYVYLLVIHIVSSRLFILIIVNIDF